MTEIRSQEWLVSWLLIRYLWNPNSGSNMKLSQKVIICQFFINSPIQCQKCLKLNLVMQIKIYLKILFWCNFLNFALSSSFQYTTNVVVISHFRSATLDTNQLSWGYIRFDCRAHSPLKYFILKSWCKTVCVR